MERSADNREVEGSNPSGPTMNGTQMSLDAKLQRLRSVIEDRGSAVIAFSGGVDSSVVCSVAREVLGEKAVAVTAVSPTYPEEELELARKIAKRIGIKHLVITTNEIENPNFTSNPPDRCYHCKGELLSKLDEIRNRLGFQSILDGTNRDDMFDYRPGLRAAAEFGVVSPLALSEMGKEDVRLAAMAFGLPNAEKPANPCLASRIPYGQEITLEKLDRISKAERYLRSLGFRILRVRDHGDLARVEVGLDELPRALELREEIVKHLKALGYGLVTLDLEGYRLSGLSQVLNRANE